MVRVRVRTYVAGNPVTYTHPHFRWLISRPRYGRRTPVVLHALDCQALRLCPGCFLFDRRAKQTFSEPARSNGLALNRTDRARLCSTALFFEFGSSAPSCSKNLVVHGDQDPSDLIKGRVGGSMDRSLVQAVSISKDSYLASCSCRCSVETTLTGVWQRPRFNIFSSGNTKT